jgi:6-phosphogluconolactonase
MAALRIYPSSSELARAAAARFTASAREAIAERGRFVVALAGGSTPRPAYERLASEPFSRHIDWARVHVFWSDERCVPPDDPGSNYRMAREALLRRVPIPDQNVHRVRGEQLPDRAASSYQAELSSVLKGDRFDLILLGMGADGHTASLFPGTSVLNERRALVRAVYPDPGRGWRVTLTLPVINAARQVLFLVVGAEKAAALAGMRAGRRLPAGRVRPADGELIWLVDRAAAGQA